MATEPIAREDFRNRSRLAVNETQRRFLRRLRDSQPDGVPRSSIPRGCEDLLQSLKVCGAVEFRRASHGRGTVLCINSVQAFQLFLDARLPRGLDVALATIPDRATAVLMLADAKAIRQGTGQGLFVRSNKEGVELRSADGQVSIPVSELTVRAGGVGVQLSPTRVWHFSGHVVVVENAECFWEHERAVPEADLAVLANGNMSRRLLNWLASEAMMECRITHWGDYDPVGVCQYLRLADVCPGRVNSHAPPEVDEILPRLGKRDLITGQAQYFARLRRRISDEYVARMVSLFDRHVRGLEQEVLLRRDFLERSV